MVSNSLWLHGPQHTRLFCPPLSPGVCSNSCPLSRWCYMTISSFAIPFTFCLQSFPSSVSFPMNRFFKSGGQSIGASASASVLPVNVQGWFLLKLTGLVSLQSKWPQEPSPAPQSESITSFLPSNPKERQCQRMFICTHFTCQWGYAQNPSS